MIDIHLHPLPFLDDGAADWAEALEMAQMAVEDGVRQWVATPHWTGTTGETEKTRETGELLRGKLRDHRLDLEVHLGNEVVLTPDLAEALKDGRALTLAGTDYVLLETAQFERGAYIHSALFKLQSHGYRVILAHPERLPSWQADLDDLRELVYRGCYLQINAGSLAGAFGRPAQRTAERLVRLGWVSFLASDGHSPDRRPPLLRDALRRVEQLAGGKTMEELVNGNPGRLLCGEYVRPITPEIRPRPRFRWLPWMR